MGSSVIEALAPECCTGCGLCAEVCPVGCIAMARDGEGFPAPVLDERRCVRCGLCARKCPSLEPLDGERGIEEGFVVAPRNRSEVAGSSSGGAFVLLARQVLQEGGVVFGAALNEKGRVVHRRVERLQDLVPLQGSKYVQSDITEAFSPCRDDLLAGREVLFSGTPCQVAAIRSFVEDHPLLLTVELVCHGVPSPGFWEQEVERLVADGSVEDPRRLSFRFTDRCNRTAFALVEDGKMVLPARDDVYYTLFLENKSLRESCYTCRYAQRLRQADLVIGDCASSLSDFAFHPDEPVSAVFPLTEAGARAFSCLVESCDWKALDVEKEMRLNKQLSNPTVRPPARDVVYEDVASLPEERLREKYLSRRTAKDRVKEAVKKIVSTKARAAIRRRIGR